MLFRSAEKLVKKARKARLLPASPVARRLTKPALAKELFALAAQAQARGWSAEELLAAEVKKTERRLRRAEVKASHG